MTGVGLCLSAPVSDGVHSVFSLCQALFDDLGEQQGKGMAGSRGCGVGSR